VTVKRSALFNKGTLLREEGKSLSLPSRTTRIHPVWGGEVLMAPGRGIFFAGWERGGGSS